MMQMPHENVRRGDLLRATLVVLCLWVSGPGVSEEVQAEETDSPSGSLGSSLFVKPSYSNSNPWENIKLVDDGVRHGALDLLLRSGMLGNLAGEGELAVSSFQSQADKLYHQDRNRLLRFRLAGGLDSFEYGAEYRSVGQGFQRPSGSNNWKADQEGEEFWAAQKFGPLRLKAMFSDFGDNVEADPRRPRTTKTLGGMGLGFTLPGGSVLSFSYQRGSSRTRGGPSKEAPQESWIEDMGASLYFYAGPMWDFTISSNYSPSTNKLDPSKKVLSSYHHITASYRPTESITITPSMSLGELGYSWSGVRMVTPTAMLSLGYYPPSGNLSFTTYGYYSRSKSNDGLYDVRTVNLINSLLIPFGKAKEMAISFDLVFNQYLDAVYRFGSSAELLGRVLYKVTGF